MLRWHPVCALGPNIVSTSSGIPAYHQHPDPPQQTIPQFPGWLHQVNDYYLDNPRTGQQVPQVPITHHRPIPLLPAQPTLTQPTLTQFVGPDPPRPDPHRGPPRSVPTIRAQSARPTIPLPLAPAHKTNNRDSTTGCGCDWSGLWQVGAAAGQSGGWGLELWVWLGGWGGSGGLWG